MDVSIHLASYSRISKLGKSNSHWKGSRNRFSTEVCSHINVKSKSVKIKGKLQRVWPHFSKQFLCEVFKLTYEAPNNEDDCNFLINSTDK